MADNIFVVYLLRYQRTLSGPHYVIGAFTTEAKASKYAVAEKLGKKDLDWWIDVFKLDPLL